MNSDIDFLFNFKDTLKSPPPETPQKRVRPEDDFNPLLLESARDTPINL